ncbi:MAG: lytic transglycosylase domain-containing protein [Thiotrichaceae bacterium]|nr:lytic transglycosylase domain-containing protein [Thiotrichaceae bacterium]
MLAPLVIALVVPVSHARTSSCISGDAQYLLKKSNKYLTEITAAAKKYKVDSDLIRSVIAIESCFNGKAVSHAGAQGLMQLIPDTADRFGVTDSFDAKQNIFAGAKYLRWLSLRFDGNLDKVLAGYNAGEGKVDKYNGIPPYRETQRYVKNVTATYNKLKGKPSAFSLRGNSLIASQDLDTIRLPPSAKKKSNHQTRARVRRDKLSNFRRVRARRVTRVPSRRSNRNVQQAKSVPVKPWGKPGRQGLAVLRQRAPHLFKKGTSRLFKKRVRLVPKLQRIYR